jgi:hypothetical protein
MFTSDFFLTIAEISLAFVGFSAVVVALRQSGAAQWSSFQRFSARILIELGFACLFLALLPLLLQLLGVGEPTVWQLSCASLGLFLLAYFTAYPFRRRPIATVSPARRWAIYSRIALNHALGVTALISSFGLGVPSGPGIYALGIAWLFFVGGLMFVLTLVAAERGE